MSISLFLFLLRMFAIVNDNVLPLMSQIVLDAHFFPDFLHLPRYQLAGFHPPSRESEAMPHLNLLRDAIPNIIDINNVRWFLDSFSLHSKRNYLTIIPPLPPPATPQLLPKYFTLATCRRRVTAFVVSFGAQGRASFTTTDW